MMRQVCWLIFLHFHYTHRPEVYRSRLSFLRPRIVCFWHWLHKHSPVHLYSIILFLVEADPYNALAIFGFDLTLCMISRFASSFFSVGVTSCLVSEQKLAPGQHWRGCLLVFTVLISPCFTKTFSFCISFYGTGQIITKQSEDGMTIHVSE